MFENWIKKNTDGIIKRMLFRSGAGGNPITNDDLEIYRKHLEVKEQTNKTPTEFDDKSKISPPQT